MIFKLRMGIMASSLAMWLEEVNGETLAGLNSESQRNHFVAIAELIGFHAHLLGHEKE